MATNRTFTMIKPDAVESGYIGGILEMINAAGFKIVAMKYTKLSLETAGKFYEVHKERPFYPGATNPAEAAEGTIRIKFGKNKGENAVHGSDSDENAAIEGAFHFAGTEVF